MTKQLNTEQLDRLAAIKEEILVLLSEAVDLVRGTPEQERANHWFATFCTALDKDNTLGSGRASASSYTDAYASRAARSCPMLPFESNELVGRRIIKLHATACSSLFSAANDNNSASE